MAQPIRNLWTPASAEMNKRGFLQQASLPLSPLPPSVFPFFPIPYPFQRLLRRLEFLVAKERMLVALATILVAILSSAKAAFIMYTDRGWGGGGRGDFLNGQNFLRSPPYHTAFFHNPPSWPKKKHSTFLRPKFHLKALRQLRERTIFSGYTLQHLLCYSLFREAKCFWCWCWCWWC